MGRLVCARLCGVEMFDSMMCRHGWGADLSVAWAILPNPAPAPSYVAGPAAAPAVVRGEVVIGPSGDGSHHSPREKVVEVYSPEPIPPNGVRSADAALPCACAQTNH